MIKSVLRALAVALGVIFFYAVVHEGGHALLVLLFGGTVTEFEVNFLVHSPHVSYIGINDPMQRALISLGGPVLPLLLVFPFTLLLRKTRSLVLQGASLLILVSLLSTLLTSAAIALSYGFGAVQSSEDVAKFLLYSGFDPFAAASLFVLMFIAILVFILRVGRVRDSALNVLAALRGAKRENRTGLVRRIFILILVVVVGAGMIQFFSQHEVRVSQPLSYHTRIDLDLQDITPDTAQFHTFEVVEPTTFDFIYSLKTQSDITLSLVSLEGNPFVFNNEDSMVMYEGNESLRLAYFTGFTLLEGSYALEVSPGSRGSLTMYIDSRKAEQTDQQYIELLAEVNAGTFTGDSYREEGYELIYQGELAVGLDQVLVAVPGGSERKISAFAVGQGSVTLTYVADGQTHTLLDGFNATIVRGLPFHRSEGELRIDVTGSPMQLYIYLSEQ